MTKKKPQHDFGCKKTSFCMTPILVSKCRRPPLSETETFFVPRISKRKLRVSRKLMMVGDFSPQQGEINCGSAVK